MDWSEFFFSMRESFLDQLIGELYLESCYVFLGDHTTKEIEKAVRKVVNEVPMDSLLDSSFRPEINGELGELTEEQKRRITEELFSVGLDKLGLRWMVGKVGVKLTGG